MIIIEVNREDFTSTLSSLDEVLLSGGLFLNLDWIETFVLAAKTENFREVARQRFIDQATVSHHIVNLEQRLGVSLFQREGRHVVLTSPGTQFLPYAERILGLVESGRQKAKEARSALHRLTLAATPYAADVILPWLCQMLLDSYPSVDIEVRVASASETIALVIRAEADGALVQDVARQSPVDYKLLMRDPLVFISPPDGGDLDAPSPQWDILLERKRLLVQPDSRYWVPILHRLKNSDTVFRIMEVNDVALTKKLVAGGLGVSVVPELSVARELMEGRLIASYPYWLAGFNDALFWMRSRDRSPSEAIAATERILSRRFPANA